MNRNSPQQIELLVSFMEKHGDLNRAHQYKDRLQLRKLWALLVARLGALTDAGSRPKSLDKWKKTWSDMKNNVKRKAARVAHAEPRPAALAPGARLAPPLYLSRLDVRVLVVMGLIQRTSSVRKVAVSHSPPPALCLPPPQAVEDVVVDAQTYEEPVSAEEADPLTGLKAEVVELEAERSASDEEFLWPETPASEPTPGAGGPGAGPGALQAAGEGLEEAGSEEPEVVEEAEVDEEPEMLEEAGPEEPETMEEAAVAVTVRPDTRGHTSTRAAGGTRRRGSGVRRALAALLRAEAARARRERHQRAEWQTLCTKGLALLERLVDRYEREGVCAGGARGCDERGEARVLHPDRERP